MTDADIISIADSMEESILCVSRLSVYLYISPNIEGVISLVLLFELFYPLIASLISLASS